MFKKIKPVKDIFPIRPGISFSRPLKCSMLRMDGGHVWRTGLFQVYSADLCHSGGEFSPKFSGSGDGRKSVAEFDSDTPEAFKIRSLDQAIGGIAVLYLKGHVMLYLGKAGLMPYAIHETWAYRVPNGDKDLTYKINRVAVTDLDLGKGTQNGSLLERLKSVRMVQ